MSERPTSEDAIKDQAIFWLSRLNSGNCSEQERRSFEDWLAQDETHRREYYQARKYWESLGKFKSGPFPFPEMDEARTYHRRRYFVFAAAAGIAFLAMAVAALWSFQSAEIPEVAYDTAKGEQKRVVLSDGSAVELNTDTRISVAFTSKARTVRLERGEAFFSIGSDRARPFEVIAGAGLIRDIGTQFSVYKEVDKVSIVVVEGAVAVMTERSVYPQPVAAGGRLSYDVVGNASKVEMIDVQAHTAWRSRRMVFKGATIDELARQISRYHDVRILVDDASLNQFTISGNFKTNDLDGLFAALGAMLPIKVTRLRNGVVRLSRDQG